MARRILIIQGHPDAGARHLCHALSEAYAQGARSAGHAVDVLDVGTIDFPLLRSKKECDEGGFPQEIGAARLAVERAEHLVFFYPLWLGGMPALLKGFLEQVMRPGIGVQGVGPKLSAHSLRGRSARIVVTMGMPALVYRWYFRAHSLRALERSVLGFMGISPVKDLLVGSVEDLDARRVDRWLVRLCDLGRRAA